MILILYLPYNNVLPLPIICHNCPTPPNRKFNARASHCAGQLQQNANLTSVYQFPLNVRGWLENHVWAQPAEWPVPLPSGLFVSPLSRFCVACQRRATEPRLEMCLPRRLSIQGLPLQIARPYKLLDLSRVNCCSNLNHDFSRMD